jgi:phenylalanyl-tRNA synthetase beta chain
LATLIVARLVEIEETIDVSEKYKDVVVVRVVKCKKIEDSDHLNVVKLDDGGKTQNVERDENGLVQVVCGAPNVRQGLHVAWLPPKTIVPDTIGTDAPFILEARKLRGVMSNGMIASPRELDLFDDHEGILEVGDDIAPGSSFADTFKLGDTLLDIENKSLTHRPDTFGVIGFAREVAGIQGKQFVTPDWLKNIAPDFGEAGGSDVSIPKVTIDNSELSARYQGVIVGNINGKVKSPLQIQTYLGRVGMRPISAVVDITNYLMLETGQPLHAFDYDKLAATNDGKIDIHVRAGRPGETLELLDKRVIELSPEDIVIANGDMPVALAGAMGGAATEVDENTKAIFLESATFNLYNLRATQMRHGIFSEAITRFTKGQPAMLTAPVLAKALVYLREFTGAVRLSEVAEDYPEKQTTIAIELTEKRVNDTLGSDLMMEDMLQILKNVEFTAEIINDSDSQRKLRVTPPYWRNDIHIPEDVIEEVGRLRGFDKISPTLPARDFTAMAPSNFDNLRKNVRDALARAGANEVLTYSFVHGDVIEKAGQKREDSYKITNSISPDLQYYRQSLTPSLLSHVHTNIKQRFDDFALFELNKVHPKPHGLTNDGVPAEVDMIALTIAHKKPGKAAPFYEAKKQLNYLAESLGLLLKYEPIENDPGYPVTAPFEYRRSALVTDEKTDTFLGIVGEYKKSVARAFKLPERTAGFEIGTLGLFNAVQKLDSSYVPLSRFPGTERDICFQVSSDTLYAKVASAAREVLTNESLETSVEPLDIYQAENSDTKNITIRIKLTSHEKTLTSSDVDPVIHRIIQAVSQKVGAVVV